MERVVTIHLNGAAFQLEEPAYDALRAYLQTAEAALSDNPDRREIISDLEQAIGDKCAARIRPGKNVVTAPEMSAILAEMGPVDGAAGESEEQPRTEGAGAYSQSRPRRRLYRIKEGGWISGISAGLGAYFDIDVTLIRVLWVISAFLTGGFTILIYIVLMFVIPPAYSSEEWAAAHGAPFNAQEVIDEAKKRFREFQESDGMKNWRQRMHVRFSAQPPPRAAYAAEMHAAPAAPVGYATQVFAGIFAVIFGIVSAVLTVAFLVAVFSIVTTGAILGFTPPVGLPLWIALVALIIVYSAIALPLRAIRRASYRTISGRRYHGDEMDGVTTLILFGVLTWLAWMFVPGAREWMIEVWTMFQTWLTQVQAEVRT